MLGQGRKDRTTGTGPQPPQPRRRLLLLLRFGFGAVVGLIKHSERVDRPEHVVEGVLVGGDKVLARGRPAGAARLAPQLARPVAAEGGVEDDVEVVEVRVDLERAAELGAGEAPCRVGGVGGAGDDVGGDCGGVLIIVVVAAGEKPDLDGGRGPLGRKDAAAVLVEVFPVRGRVAVLDQAAGVLVLIWSVDIAVGSDQVTAVGLFLRQFHSRSGVKGHPVAGLLVHPFEDVDLASGRPGRSNHPECWPG